MSMQETELTEWPKNKRGHYICSSTHPMPKSADGRWEHQGAREVGEQEDGYPGGDIITVKCIDCGKQWREELPQ